MRIALATRTADRPIARAPADASGARRRTLVIVGNGMVSHRLCRQLIAGGAAANYDIVVFGEEPLPAYDRVHLTDYFTGRGNDELLLSPASWYREHDIDLRLGDPVVHMDCEARTVRSASGVEVVYDRLVLATGSSPHVPPIEGANVPTVLVYRTLADLEAIRQRARRSSSAAVIGGGLLGLEAARALQHLGLRTSVIEAATTLMPAQLDQSGGEELGRRIAALGIDVRTSAMTTRVETTERGHTLRFAGGDCLVVDMVVVAAGIRPRSELARRCGLRRSPEGGVVVDDQLRTSNPRVFAIGECASHRAEIHGLAAPGYAMADALALILAGRSTRFVPPSTATRLKVLDVEVTTTGEPLERGNAVRFRSETGYRLIRIEQGRLVGALAVGAWDDVQRLEDGTARRTRVWPWEIARFKRTGMLWRSRQARSVMEWPASAVICACMNVTRGDLSRAAGASHVVTVESLAERTGASTVCGSCRSHLAELACAPAAPQPAARALLVGSVAAVIAAAVLWAAPPVPFAESIEHAWRTDGLWRSGEARQISGFALVALALVASLLSVRKRWRRASLAGAFPAWRLAHVAIGVLTLAALAVHTGARTGNNLTFALMASFSTVNVVGGVAGGFTAGEGRLAASTGRKLRSAMVVAHIIAAWPLPVLVAFHVLSVYYF